MYVRSHVESDGNTTRTPHKPEGAMHSVSDAASYLADSAKPILSALEDSVRRKPGLAVAVAAAAGVLLALGVRRWR